jgi:hypothetical protein
MKPGTLQLKLYLYLLVPTAAPVITEVIPPVGPPNGGTRVAVLGNNFVDSPAARIRFDTTDVMPMFHGPGTLICHTPQHTPGTVSVRVCNSTKKWSETSATFTYDSSLETFRDAFSESIIARQTFGTYFKVLLQSCHWNL